MKLPPKQSAEVNMARRGPPSSTQRGRTPRPGAQEEDGDAGRSSRDPWLPIVRRHWVMPISFDIGRLNTLKA
jgi:hypothetical protein